VNDEAKKFNRKLWKYMKLNDNVTILEIPQDSDHFTRHGLHFNGQGKENICSQLASIIGELFQHTEVLPISLGWENNQAVTLERETSITCNYINNVVLNDDVGDSRKEKESNVTRTSNRQKKVPINRTDDFLWQI
jgi:hypothetical protein